jgi:hypothetical protein
VINHRKPAAPGAIGSGSSLAGVLLMAGVDGSVPGQATDLLGKLRTQSLEELAPQCEWSRSVNSFLTPRATFRTVLQSLINHEYWFDATTLLAHALPQREAVWWAALVCDDYLDANALQGEQREEEEVVLAAARAWVGAPEEPLRIKAYHAAMAIPNRVPSHWVGMSVFWATGNITLDAGVVTPPPPYLYARGVSAAIDLAANLTAHARTEVYQRALGRGVDVASGGDGGRILSL